MMKPLIVGFAGLLIATLAPRPAAAWSHSGYHGSASGGGGSWSASGRYGGSASGGGGSWSGTGARGGTASGGSGSWSAHGAAGGSASGGDGTWSSHSAYGTSTYHTSGYYGGATTHTNYYGGSSATYHTTNYYGGTYSSYHPPTTVNVLRIDLHQLRGVVDGWRRRRRYGGRHGDGGGRWRRRRPMRPRRTLRTLTTPATSRAARTPRRPLPLPAVTRWARSTRRCRRDACNRAASARRTTSAAITGSNRPMAQTASITASSRRLDGRRIETRERGSTNDQTTFLLARIGDRGALCRCSLRPAVPADGQDRRRAHPEVPVRFLRTTLAEEATAEERAPEGVRSASARRPAGTHLFHQPGRGAHRQQDVRMRDDPIEEIACALPLATSRAIRKRLLMNGVKQIVALALSGVLFAFLPSSSIAQQVTGELGSPSATSTISGKQLPPPDPKFGGVINVKASDSKPWWPPRVVPPKGAPNVLLIMTDDCGFGSPSTFGGVIPTPALDRIAKSGLRYTQFHSTSLCSPTRAALITGRNHHVAGFGVVGEAATGFPGYDSVIREDAARSAKSSSRTATRRRGSARTTTRPSIKRPGRAVRSMAQRDGLRILLRLRRR